MAIKLKIPDLSPVKFNITSTPVALKINMVTVEQPKDPYTGEYEFTPSSNTQTIYVKDLTPTNNITINPIPNNYGLITWNGAALTVS